MTHGVYVRVPEPRPLSLNAVRYRSTRPWTFAAAMAKVTFSRSGAMVISKRQRCQRDIDNVVVFPWSAKTTVADRHHRCLRREPAPNHRQPLRDDDGSATRCSENSRVCTRKLRPGEPPSRAPHAALGSKSRRRRSGLVLQPTKGKRQRCHVFIDNVVMRSLPWRRLAKGSSPLAKALSLCGPPMLRRRTPPILGPARDRSSF
jgi:hypothetical protein